MESDLRELAQNMGDVFQEFQSGEDEALYRSCLDYVRDSEDQTGVQLQFVNIDGMVVASSVPEQEGLFTDTADVAEAVNPRGVTTQVGADVSVGDRVIAVSSPVIYATGEVAGVLRHVLDTGSVDRKIINIALICFVSMLSVLGVV